MKMILARDGVKREIEGPFALLMGRRDMESLVQELRQILADDEYSYGWRIIDTHRAVDIPANTPPTPWAITREPPR